MTERLGAYGSLPRLVEAVRAGQVRAVARAISLVESGDPDTAAALARLLAPGSGAAHLVGFTGPPGVAWKDDLRTVGAATGRLEAANRLVEDFDRQADRVGADSDAVHFQASVVQFTDTTMRVFGTDNFPASVLADVGVDRPPTQRFSDKPYVEVGITDTDLADSPDFSAADGDIVYVSFATAEARGRAHEVMTSDAWKKLSANRDNRIYAVNNEVSHTGQGIVAARGIMADLRLVNAPIN